jgi:rSAM/selenodomain-associated transferase 2
MSAPLSIIIPTHNAASEIGPTLSALVPGLLGGLINQLVIVDCGSEDDIEALADAAGADFLISEPGRGQQFRAGVEAARADWFLFLHADTALPEDWVKLVGDHINAHPDKAAVFKLSFAKKGLAPQVIASWANFRTRRLGLPFGDQGLLISRALYRSSGGYARIPLMEDLDLARRLRGRFVTLDGKVTTSFARYADRGWVSQGLGNLLRQMRFLMGQSPTDLAKRYK